MGAFATMGKAMKNMTVKQIKKVCSEHKYILLRLESGALVGINCKIGKFAEKMHEYSDTHETKYVSYIPCSFHEYLNYKYPFIAV